MPHERRPDNGSGHDYVIVGAGSAGCVLAHRLSQQPGTSVLLLEAGGRDRRLEIHIPAAFSKLLKTDVDWGYHTEPQAALDGRPLFWPRGKVLGGSSAINAMIYIRGHRHVFDGWAAAGNAGWGAAELQPYFLRSECFHGPPSPHHGTGGRLHVSPLRDPNPLSHAFVDAAVAHGLPPNDDFNGPQQTGAGLFHVTQHRGRRCSSAHAFLRPASKRPNLTVRTHTRATAIRFAGRRAVGVDVAAGDGTTGTVRAHREVILCGGAINSPQLLLLSGIGPAAELEALGIPVAQDLPGVGHNLSDHLAVVLCWACTQPITLHAAESLGSLLRYAFLRRGLLTSNVAEAGAFLRLHPDAPCPDLQFHFAPTYYIRHGFDNPPSHGFSLGPTLVQPRSRGRLQLASRDPAAAPRIDPAYLTHPDDLDRLVAGMRLARELAAGAAFAPFRGAEYLPGDDHQHDDDLRAFIRRNAETLYHPVGTCRMGHDAQAVVDDRLRVHGCTGLRVADASIMPTIVNGNTNAAAIMIGEKAADLIAEG